MKIVIPDGYTLNPGDLSWDAISQYGDLDIFDRSTEPEMIERCREADIILTNKAIVSKAVIHNAKNLKLICVTATGYNIVDIEAARLRSIPVSNVPGYGTASVTQHTIALMLEIANHVGKNSASVLSGDWVDCKDFSYTKGPITELQGKIIGIVGLGKIGEQVAMVAKALGMRVLYSGRTNKNTNIAEFVSLEELFGTSDVISLHCPLTKENQSFVNKDLLKHVKKTAWLINTSRGQLIHEQDLADALQHDEIAAAGLDVLSTEPPSSNNPLLRAKNCIITPHTAWISLEARIRILDATEHNIAGYLNGHPVNVVN
ncbi:MAG: D-2-hydroxyacid dehydrogenase [Chryseolinea sp.]